ncbi:MAG: DUF4358 domain-containing protein [Oscillospiraceae bacterium]
MKKFVLSLGLTAVALLVLLTSCTGGQTQKQADLSAFAQTIQEKYEFAAYLMEQDPEADEFAKQSIEQYLPGLLDLDLEQRVIYMSMITMNNGEFSMVQAKSAEDAAKVGEIFQARIDYMAGDGKTPGGAWYPGPTELWTNSARVEVNGCYVLMVTAEECDQIVSEFNELLK